MNKKSKKIKPFSKVTTITHYPNKDSKIKILITTPHDSNSYEYFWSSFPEILTHPKIQEKKNLFHQYLQMEQDRGAQILAHKLADTLSKRTREKEKNFGVCVIEFNAPRGILDCGRLKTHCLRGFLPGELKEKYKKNLLSFHEKSHRNLAVVINLLNKNKGFFIDLHTMSPFGPEKKFALDYRKDLPEEKWENLNHYLNIYSRDSKKKRNLDIITEDENKNFIANKNLFFKLESSLSQHFSLSENIPYQALSFFLMSTLMKKAKGIALDFPKNLISIENIENNQFPLSTFQISEKKYNKRRIFRG